MKTSRRPSLALASLLLLPALILNFTGCLADDSGTNINDSTKVIDPFPKPQGPKMIPLDQESNSEFRYVETDSDDRVSRRIPALMLYIAKRRADIYTYAFENPKLGYLVQYREFAAKESSGVYILGSFKDTVEDIHPVPTLWLPQFPESGKTWPVGFGRTMQLMDSSETYFTETLFPNDTVEAPVYQGFQRHTTYLFKETAQGDTVTHYHFRKGVGCLGFERMVGERLIATGTIKSFYKVSWRPF